MEKIFALFLCLMMLMQAHGFGQAQRKADDANSVGKAYDIWHKDDHIESHIQDKSFDGPIYLRFAHQLALDVEYFDKNGQHTWTQRSHVADALAIFISRNFRADAQEKVTDIQVMLTNAESHLQNSTLRADANLKKTFYTDMIKALAHSSWLSDSFYRRAITWVLKVESRLQVRFFNEWMKRNDSPELSKFLKNFSEFNQDFIRELIIHPDNGQRDARFWRHFLSMAGVSVKFSIENTILYADPSVRAKSKECSVMVGQATAQ